MHCAVISIDIQVIYFRGYFLYGKWIHDRWHDCTLRENFYFFTGENGTWNKVQVITKFPRFKMKDGGLKPQCRSTTLVLPCTIHNTLSFKAAKLLIQNIRREEQDIVCTHDVVIRSVPE